MRLEVFYRRLSSDSRLFKEPLRNYFLIWRQAPGDRGRRRADFVIGK